MQRAVGGAAGAAAAAAAAARAANGGSCAASGKNSVFRYLRHRLPASAQASGFESSIFPVEKVQLFDRSEQVVRGGRHLFPLLPRALAGVRQIGVIGWGSQGPAQAQNLRESLAGSGIRVKVGLRADSASAASARRANFTEGGGTLGEMLQVVRESDLSIVLISDAALADRYREIFSALRPNSYLGLSHGFLAGYLEAMGEAFPPNVGVVAVCPKGVGPSVRRLYEQGRDVNGAGINSSFAVLNDVDGRATDIALAWAVALGSPYVFQTTLEAEYKSDIFGERGILLGAAHGLCEVLYRYKVAGEPAGGGKAGAAAGAAAEAPTVESLAAAAAAADAEASAADAAVRPATVPSATERNAYLSTVECIVRPLSRMISRSGISAVRAAFASDPASLRQFDRAYAAAYGPALEVLAEIYDEVASRRELLGVIDAGRRLPVFPMKNVDESPLWRVAAAVRPTLGVENGAGDAGAPAAVPTPLCPLTAGFYVATMVAQCDLLRAAGHAYSEIANESVIEAVDSLNPYMRFRGVAYMIDNCSQTARLGARRWAPRFDYVFQQQALPRLDSPAALSDAEVAAAVAALESNPIHEILRVCAAMRPSVDIVPQVTHLG